MVPCVRRIHNRSAVGSPVLENDNLVGLLRTFVGYVPTYELQCQYDNHIESLGVPRKCPNWISLVIEHMKGLFIREQDRKKAQALLGVAINDYLDAIDHEGHSTSFRTPCEEWLTHRVWLAETYPIVDTVMRACDLYTITGENGEATAILKLLVSNLRREVPEFYKTQDAYRFKFLALGFCLVDIYQYGGAVDVPKECFGMPASAANSDVSKKL